MEHYRIKNKAEESRCDECGSRLAVGDPAVTDNDGIFCCEFCAIENRATILKRTTRMRLAWHRGERAWPKWRRNELAEAIRERRRLGIQQAT